MSVTELRTTSLHPDIGSPCTEIGMEPQRETNTDYLIPATPQSNPWVCPDAENWSNGHKTDSLGPKTTDSAYADPSIYAITATSSNFIRHLGSDDSSILEPVDNSDRFQASSEAADTLSTPGSHSSSFYARRRTQRF